MHCAHCTHTDPLRSHHTHSHSHLKLLIMVLLLSIVPSGLLIPVFGAVISLRYFSLENARDGSAYCTHFRKLRGSAKLMTENCMAKNVQEMHHNDAMHTCQPSVGGIHLHR